VSVQETKMGLALFPITRGTGMSSSTETSSEREMVTATRSTLLAEYEAHVAA